MKIYIEPDLEIDVDGTLGIICDCMVCPHCFKYILIENKDIVYVVFVDKYIKDNRHINDYHLLVKYPECGKSFMTVYTVINNI